jgi:hypothetical protein
MKAQRHKEDAAKPPLDFDDIRLNPFVIASKAKQSSPTLNCFALLAMTIHLDVIPL